MRSIERTYLVPHVVCGAVACVLGVLALIGWVSHTEILLRPDQASGAITVSAGLGLVLCGCWLAMQRLPQAASPVASKRWATLIGLPLLCWSVAMLAQTMFGADIGIDARSFHQWLPGSSPHPGRMAPNTALGFTLLSLGLLIDGSSGSSQPRYRQLLYAIGLGVVAIGLTGLLSLMIRPELLFGWQRNVVRMAPYTGVGMLTLGLGFSSVWQSALTHADHPNAHGHRITRMAAMSLTVVALITGSVGFSMQLDSITRDAATHLSRTLNDRRLVLEEALASAKQKVELTSTNPAVAAELRELSHNRSSATVHKALASVAQSLLPEGFSFVGIEQAYDLHASAGQAMGQPEVEIALQGGGQSSLAWLNGSYVVRHKTAILDEHGVTGYLITEQPLKVLPLLNAEVSTWGDSFDMAMCTSKGADIHCFPQRQRRTGFTSPKIINGQPLPMVLALNGQSGITTRGDFRQHQVMAAYTPLGKTGLGMVLKVDTQELYAPARKHLLLALPLIALITFVGVWAMRMRLRPVVQELLITRQAAKENEARFVAAMESSLDAFYILKAERNAHGDICDFRFTYVTARGASLVSLRPDQIEGQLLCELLPINRTGGFFDKYKIVVETGEALSEEFAIEQPGVVATWISHQIVKFGGDCIAITSRDISAKKQAEEAVAASEERLRLITDSVPAMIAYLNTDQRYLFVNRGGAELYGMPIENIVGKTVLEVVGPANYALMSPHIDTVAAGYPVTFERQVTRLDGVRHVLTSYFPQYDDHGHVTNVCVLAHDITARKQMEAALATSEERLKAVTDNMPALISYIDRDNRFRFANLAYKEWLDVEPSSLIGRSLLDVYGEPVFGKIQPYLARAFAGEPLHYERDMVCANGVRQVHVSMTPHCKASGEVVGLYVMATDITPLKEAERRSARSEERLTLALEGSHLALFDWDVSARQVYHSAHWSMMLGGPAVESTTSLEALAQLVHPDDRLAVQTKISEAIKGITPFYSAEHRVRTQSGEWLWIWSRGRVVERDAEGWALRLSGTNADITEQKCLEAKLQRMAEIDNLTGLPNRALFNDRLQHAMTRARRHGSGMALMLLDIDYFKQINDTLGHDAGDAVLQEFASRMRAAVRATDTVARLGGDEFTIILEELHTAAEAELVATKAVAAMTDAFTHAGHLLRVSTSIGVAYADDTSEDALALIKRADRALYAAKAAGRNGYRCSSEPQEDAHAAQAIRV